jgi:hypothetical protein
MIAGGFARYGIVEIKLREIRTASGMLLPAWDGTAADDMALLRIHPGIAGTRFADLYGAPLGAALDVTLVGYGLVETNVGQIGEMLRVGWQQARFDPDRGPVLYWDYELRPSANPRSNICHGDSGGPVYFGTHRGWTGEVHALVAVISRTESCSTAKAFTTLVTADSRLWVCGVVSDRPDLCPRAN